MSGLLDGGVGIVTGAGSGIGRASALAFVKEGARGIVVADVNEAGGEATVSLIRDAGGDATFVRCDVSREADVEAMVETSLEVYGGLDYAHNNAGIGPRYASLTEVTEDDWERGIGVNLKGVWLCMKHELRAMVRQNKGAIVNTSSVGGIRGMPYSTVYTASKHGVVGLTKVAAIEFADRGIRVNAICPGSVETPMQHEGDGGLSAFLAANDIPPRGGRVQRRSTPEEQAEVAVWLCSERASYVNGVAFPVDAGHTA